MHKVNFGILLVLAMAGATPLVAATLEGTYQITTTSQNGLNVGMNLYFPAGYDDPANAGVRYPLWVFLGGAGETGNPNIASVVLDRTTRHGPSKEIVKNKRDYPCIVVTPCTQALQAAHPNWINDMVELLKSTQRVDADRVYFSGLCTGSGGVMEYAQLYPQQLAGIFPIITQSGFWNPGRLAQVPSWMFHAYGDSSVERFETINWVNAIANAQTSPALDCMNGYPYTYTEGGSPRMSDVDQTATFRPEAGWDWQPGVVPTANTLLRFTLYGSSDHNVWQKTVNNPTVLRWAFRQHRKAPYGAVATSIPGVVQAENFDQGGPRLAYQDFTSTNTGGSNVRQVANTFDGVLDDEEVDLADIDGATVLTDTQTGEWLDYTVNASSGTYALTVRAAATIAGSSFHLASNGIALTPVISVPNASAFSNIVVPGVVMNPGLQTLRLVVDSGGFQIDWFSIDLPMGPADLIVDNRQVDRVLTTGSWTTTSWTAGFYATDYLSAAPGVTATATFTPTLPRAGWYRVYTQYPASGSRGVAQVTVHHGDGSQVYVGQVDQRVGGGMWQSVGAFECVAGNNVSVIVSSAGATGYVSADAVRFVELPSAPLVDLVIDNRDGARVTTSGRWSLTSWTPGFYATDYLSATPGSNCTAVFTPNLPRAGYFKVYVQYPANGARGISPITVAHEDGTQLYATSVDQRTRGGEWVSLGAFHFNAGQGPAVTISSLNAGGYVSADAVRFEQVEDLPNIDLIVDNIDGARITKTGPWTLTSWTAGFYATDYLSATPGSNCTAVFQPNFTRPGNFQVYIQYPSNGSRGVSPVTVAHEDGSVIYQTAVDQRLQGGTWNWIGDFHFEAGAGPAVTISSLNAGGYVSADAIRFVQIESLPAIDRIVDNIDSARVTMVGGWSVTTSRPGYYGPNYVSVSPSVDKYVMFRPNLTRSATVDISIWHPSSPSRGTTPVTIVYGDGTQSTVVNVDQSSNGNQWRFLGTFPVESGGASSVTVGSFAGGGWISADAIRFQESVISSSN